MSLCPISFASAYWALETAKRFAGAGGGVSGAPTTVDGPTMFAHSGGMTFHEGGLVPRFHSGGLSPDERLAILQTNEYVISGKGVKAAGLGTLNAINSGKMPVAEGGQSGTENNNYFITANDAKSFADMVKRNPSAITGAVNRDLRMAGSTRNSMRTYL